RSPAQKSACKDLRRNGQRAAITPEAAYTPVSNRAGSRSLKNSIHPCFTKGRMLQRGTTQIHITFTSNASTTPKITIFRGPES
ncbi:ATP-dependent nuclease subunit B, partial [Lacticaseibacillus rhamnosus]